MLMVRIYFQVGIVVATHEFTPYGTPPRRAEFLPKPHPVFFLRLVPSRGSRSLFNDLCPFQLYDPSCSPTNRFSDNDAVTFAKPEPSSRNKWSQAGPTSWGQRRRGAQTGQTSRTPSTGGARNTIKNCCFNFQKDTCSRQQCAWRHICNLCGSLDHGASKCPTNNAQS